jgi:two-component system response regulator MprA
VPPFRAAAELTILLVDDDPGVLASLARVLVSEGWRVVRASNGEEALERLTEHQPDLLITDLSMGAVSGWDLLFHEHLQRPSLPIFVITALPPPAVGGADRFASEFFQKPLDLDALVQAIRRRLAVPASPQS